MEMRIHLIIIVQHSHIVTLSFPIIKKAFSAKPAMMKYLVTETRKQGSSFKGTVWYLCRRSYSSHGSLFRTSSFAIQHLSH